MAPTLGHLDATAAISARSSATRSASTWTWTFSMTTETSALPLRACRKNVR